jgi:phosphonatase-like hydrolase
VIELVAFDVAGTTVQEHGAVYRALEDAVVAAGTAVTQDDVRHWMGADKHEAVRALLGGEPGDERVEEVHADFRARLDAAYAERPPAPFDGVPELFSELRARGTRVALTTGFERAIAEPLVATVGWGDGAIDALICADDVPSGRPAPYMVFRAMERCGVQRVDRVVVVGDTALDLRAGSASGAAGVVGVLSGGADAGTLGAERHTHLIRDAAALPAVLADLD